MTSKDSSTQAPAAGQIKRRIIVAASALAVVGVCLAIRAIGGRDPANAQGPVGRSSAVASDNAASPRAANPAPSQTAGATSSHQQVVAVVNAEEIHRQQLATEALSLFGKDVLEGLMTRYLISNYAKKMRVTVSKQEVDEEITRMARKFSIPPDQWLQMIKDERGIKPEQYANDIIWPTLVLRKLAADRIQPTEKEIEDAYQAQFGPAVRARLIVLEDYKTAERVRNEALKQPAEFGALARKYSVDTTSASINGLIQPIRHNLGDPMMEKIAFQLKEGEISPVVEVGGQFVILKSEGQAQTSGAPPRDQVRGRLEELVRDKKLRTEATDLFKHLQETSQVVNVYNDPQKRAQMPGIAASINGQNITIRELAEECIERHGPEVLDVMIHRKLLEQALKMRRITVNQAQLDAEVAHAAMLAGKVTNNGKPDTAGWLKMVVEQQKVPLEKYMRDSVWPSAALKLLVADKIKITEEDIERGYKANYGARAQVRAIVLDNQRKAQEAWQQARENPTIEFFGKLAEQLSVEPASKSNAGRVPPIQQCGGQPELEKEAFSLQPGELSGIIQVQDKFVVLFLERFTDPIKVSREDVRDLIVEDIHEKKLRFEMGREFDRIKENSNIDNFLAGTSHVPVRKALGKGAEPAISGPPGRLPQGPPQNAGQPPAGGNRPVQFQTPAQDRQPAAGRPRVGSPAVR